MPNERAKAATAKGLLRERKPQHNCDSVATEQATWWRPSGDAICAVTTAAQNAQRKAQEAQRNAQQAAINQQKAAQMSGEVNKYKALIIQAISQHWILPEHVDRQLFSQFRIQLAPNGQVLSVGLIRSSGDPVLDRSAQAAIYKASPLPVPTDSEMFNLFRDISLTVRPESTRG